MQHTNIRVQKLLSWYQVSQRELPWRGTNDPYKIWLSEVMLQQTQVNTVIPYYKLWIDTFPTLTDVSRTSLDRVLKIWEGLGYYARGRNFHRACQIVVREYDGIIPSSWKEFRALPGVGDYTAAAVLSLAFGMQYPVLDGNVFRVMSRLRSFDGKRIDGEKEFDTLLRKWIIKYDPAMFNQAFMELGSQICKRRNPHCKRCPLSSYCSAYSKGNPELYPVPNKKPQRPHWTVVAGMIWNNNRFLIQKRPLKGHLGGLWEFPGGKVEEGEELSRALSREILEETGLVVVPGPTQAVVKHNYTHFSITLHVFHCYLKGSSVPLETKDRRWITPQQIADYSFPKANHKLFEQLYKHGWQR